MPDDEKMDELLSQMMTPVPQPSLSSNFDQRLKKRLKPRRLDATGKRAMAAYVILALVISIGVMRMKGVSWGVIAVAVLAPLGVALIIQRRYA